MHRGQPSAATLVAASFVTTILMRKTNYRQLLGALAMLAVAVASPLAAQDKALSLADCYRLAEQNQPDLATAEADVQVAEAHLKERRSPYFPHLSFGASHNQQTYNV